MKKGIIGRKVGMTQIFDEKGNVIPVTVIEAGPCVVAQVKTVETDGYDAVQLGFGEVKDKHINKPEKGHFAKAGLEAKKHLREFRLDSVEGVKVGDTVNADVFEAGEKIDVQGTSKGKGFQGVIKRHGQHRGPMGHGSMYHRRPGSMGPTSTPGRVFKGKKVSDVELAESVFGIEPNEAIVHSVLVNYLANQRQGTQSTKTRAEVRGGGRKPWRQKGTGRARQGSIRAPQWIKGGIALGPKPRSYRYTVNKKERRLAIKSLLSSKVLENELTVVDKLELSEIKTKTMVKALADLKVEGKTLIVLPENNKNVLMSARNIEGVKTIVLNNINVFDLLKYNNLVLPLETVKKLEEVYA